MLLCYVKQVFANWYSCDVSIRITNHMKISLNAKANQKLKGIGAST